MVNSVETVEVVGGKRRVLVEPMPNIDPNSPVKRVRLSDTLSTTQMPPLHDLASSEAYTMTMWNNDDPFESPVAAPKRPRRSKVAVRPRAMADWLLEYREEYLQAMVWLDGRGLYHSQSHCPGCQTSTRESKYRCTDCSCGALLCRHCIVQQHHANPFHWIEVSTLTIRSYLSHLLQEWNGVFFRRVSLKSLDLHIQLGHPAGEICPLPQPGHREFIVVHNNGIHEAAIDFCGCQHHGRASNATQLLRARLYPSTGSCPQTCTTFDCLDSFHALSLHGKTSAYDFYRALEYRSSGYGNRPPDRYRPFLRMARQFRHLLLLKRRGRAHTTSSIVQTAPGELAIRCPACPRPGVNLPEDWLSAPPQDQCLYIMFIAMDACFRLKRRLISSDLRDPGLGTGWAYMVEWEPYRQYLLTVTDQNEISTCTGLAALDHANTKYANGYSATGVGAGVCARHEFVLPTGVADLQRGERYANMDYVLASILRHINPLLRKIFSYDIACQWGKHLKERLLELPPLVRIRLVMGLCRFAVPKMHLNAHIVICRLLFSLALILGSGQTDGEGIERLWASIAGVAGSTKLSGHGARADQLDDHWSFWNWLKLVGLPKLLQHRLEKARAELEKQEASFRMFSAQQAEHVPKWLEMVHAFEADESQPNPYDTAEKEAISEAEVRKELEEDDRKAVEEGVPPLHAVNPSDFIVFGLELEDQQRHLQVQAQLKRSSSSTGLNIRLKPLRKKLTKGIRRFRDLQATYTPPALLHYQRLVLPVDIHPESIPLLLPSDLLPNKRTGCSTSLLEIERRLRHAQCKAALARLRHQLHVKARLLIYKKHQSRNQGMNTRSRLLVARNESKIKAHADTYQAARKALANIDAAMTEDPEDADEEAEAGGRQTKVSSGESKRAVSWIWTMTGLTGGEASLEDSLHVEWSKAYARVRWWREEVRILEEEQRRYPISLAHEEKQWEKRKEVAVQLGGDKRVVEGRVAYAAKQAAVYGDLIRRADGVRKAKWKGKGYQGDRHWPDSVAPVATEDGDEQHPDLADDSDDSSDESSEESVATDSGNDDDDDD
ncbi:CxC2 domain-containing protein [Mycena kentingensis (nom. inval.)]|nr:CxC2 domain-containing protein [Mycena kentingensis (nom. inval.)]